MFDEVWWHAKVDLNVDRQLLESLCTIEDWTCQGRSAVNRNRALTALQAMDSLAYAYDSYRDCVRPIYAGVDWPTNQVYFIRESAKGGFYITAKQPVSFAS